MPDHPSVELPRIALVFGDEAAAAHVREAVAGQVQVVYAVRALEIDAARLAGVSAALVNVDDDDWIGFVELTLHDAGVPAVFNDPAISGKLEGWARSRWLRHLVAKLRGSADVDPPRPATLAPVATTAAVAPVPVDAASQPQPAPRGAGVHPFEAHAAPVPAVPALAGIGVPAPEPMAEPDPPLALADPHEPGVVVGAGVASVAIDPVDPPAPVLVETRIALVPAATAEASPPPAAGAAIAPPMEATVETSASPIEPAAALPIESEPALATPAESEPSAAPFDESDGSLATAAESALAMSDAPAIDADDTLDVDTEALSAMIDARLAEPEAQRPAPGQVWRVAPGGTVSAVEFEKISGLEHSLEPAAPAQPVTNPAAAPAVAPVDEADVLASLPSLDDWQLVDANPPAQPAPAAHAPTALESMSLDDFDGLELVPLEVISPIQHHTDPIERWLHDSAVAKPKAGSDAAAGAKANGAKP